MKNILLDTNILHPGLWTANLQALNHLVEQGVIALYIPDMVKREKISKVSSEIQVELEKAISSVKSVNKKGIKDKPFLRTVEMAETILRGLSDSAEEKAISDFDTWVKQTNTNVFELSPSKVKCVIDDYFAGKGAYSNKKERKDIPDSIIHHTALSIRDEIGKLTCIVGDSNLRKALAKEEDIDVYGSLDSLFELDEIKEHIKNFSLKPHLMAKEFSNFVMKNLRNNPNLIDEVETEKISYLFILNIDAFYPRISHVQADSLEELKFIDIFDIGSDKFSAKFTFTARAYLTYTTDYETFLELDNRDDRDVTMLDMNGDGFCELLETVDAKFYGHSVFWFGEPQTPADIQAINANPEEAEVEMLFDIEIHKAKLNELVYSY